MQSKDWTPQQIQASYELIRRGSLRHLMHSGQRKFADLIKSKPNEKEFFLYCARRWGKSHVLCLLGIEHCLSKPNRVVRHIFPVAKTAREAVFALMSEISVSLPPELRPLLKRSEATYYFPNGSIYKLGGAQPETIDSNRGVAATFLLCDEIGFWDEGCFNELLYSVLYPQIMHFPDAKVLFVTTPPSSTTHPVLTDVLPRVQAADCFRKATVFDNPLLSKKQIDDMIALMGGPESNAVKRELMAELIPDDSRRIVPEFNRKLHVIKDEPQPLDRFGKHIEYQGMIVADYGVGTTDFCGITASYYDHLQNRMVVCGEWLGRGTGIADLQERMSELIENTLAHCTTLDICIDVMEQTAVELRKAGVRFRRPIKGKVEDQVALTRNALVANKLFVHERCTKLINTLEQGLWKESEKTRDYERTREYGHADLIAALNYAVRLNPWGRFPGQTSQLPLGKKRK